MATFKYTALDNKGHKQKGTISADTSKSVRSLLREQSLLPIDVTILVKEATGHAIKTQGIDQKISTLQLSLFTEELASLLMAGLELEESLKSVSSATENEKFKYILLGVHSKIIEGYTFAQGLNEFPKAFPKIYRATVQAGEEAGYLGDVLGNLSDYLESQHHIRQRIKQALIYPCILSLVSFGIVVFLLTYVAPKIITIFSESEQALPFATVALIAISDFLVAYGWLLVVFFIAVIFLFKWMMKFENIKYSYDLFLLKLPFIGKTIKTIQTSRFLRALGILTHSHVPILKAISVSANLVTILPIKANLEASMNRVKEGTSIYLSFKNTGYFSPICLQFVASGEKSGNLDKMLTNAAKQQERQVQITLDTILTLFEPLLILLMGCVVLFIVLAILLPMFEISNLIT